MLAHVAGLPVEETLAFAAPAIGAAWAAAAVGARAWWEWRGQRREWQERRRDDRRRRKAGVGRR